MERLNAMKAEIEKLKMNIELWEDMDCIKALVFRSKDGKCIYVNRCDFDVQKLKAETLQSMRDKLDKLEKEFKEA